MDHTETVRSFYDSDPDLEWRRLQEAPFEFRHSVHFLERYLRPGDRVLDLGGGPGRYSLHFAKRGCRMTLADLSPGNVAFARERAAAEGLELRAVEMDARNLSALGEEQFDHILLLGPLYHLSEEADRVRVVEECLAHLRPGGILACAFISHFAGIIYAMREDPPAVMVEKESGYVQSVVEDRAFGGSGFTHVHMERYGDILPFFGRFPLEKLHLISAEGILAPNVHNLLAQTAEVVEHWINLSIRLCEREDLMALAKHYLYIGRKKEG